MQAGPFDWKEAAVGKVVRVEIGNESFSVSRNGKNSTARFSDIDAIYFYQMYLTPIAHMLHIEAVLKDSTSIGFGASGFGPPNGFAAEECRKATISFLKQFEETVPHGEVFEGSRPSAYFNVSFFGMIVLVLIFTTYQGWREGMFEDILYGIAVFGIVAVIMVIWSLFHFRKYNKPVSILAKTAYERLKQYY